MQEFTDIQPGLNLVVEDASLALDSPLANMGQQLGQKLTSAAMFFMTSTVPYGYNEAVSLRVNHRLCQQRESMRSSAKHMPTIEQSILCEAETRDRQTFQNGNLQIVPYQAHILGSNSVDPKLAIFYTNPEETRESLASSSEPGEETKNEGPEQRKQAEEEPIRYES